jgi:hypothetical protein
LTPLQVLGLVTLFANIPCGTPYRCLELVTELAEERVKGMRDGQTETQSINKLKKTRTDFRNYEGENGDKKYDEPTLFPAEDPDPIQAYESHEELAERNFEFSQFRATGKRLTRSFVRAKELK